MINRFASAGYFLNESDLDIKKYSKLKFGSQYAARDLGHEMAEQFVNCYVDKIVNEKIVVISSPYNELANAATSLANEFYWRLKFLLRRYPINATQSTIRREAPHILDYGFLTDEQRKAQMNRGTYTINREEIGDRLILFVDDVRISSSHEDTLIRVMKENNINNESIFLYHAIYAGSDATIESRLNFGAIRHVDDFIRICKAPDFKFLVRPVKYIMSRPLEDFKRILDFLSARQRVELQQAVELEKYNEVESYKENYETLLRWQDQ